VLSSGRADFVAFGVPFIGNPDLVARLKKIVLDRFYSSKYDGGHL
jgi:2,4-dienoyl-CoA reductase-like NADH-dependent reductase (Old Yellow Enzyme family)